MWWHRKLGVALTCADWRQHQSRVNLNKRLCKLLHVGGLGMAAIPGPDGLTKPERRVEWIMATNWINILIGSHNPVVLAVVAHQRCLAHPVPDHEHDGDVAKTAKALKEQTGFAGPVVAVVAVHHSNTQWSLRKVAEF